MNWHRKGDELSLWQQAGIQWKYSVPFTFFTLCFIAAIYQERENDFVFWIIYTEWRKTVRGVNMSEKWLFLLMNPPLPWSPAVFSQTDRTRSGSLSPVCGRPSSSPFMPDQSESEAERTAPGAVALRHRSDQGYNRIPAPSWEHRNLQNPQVEEVWDDQNRAVQPNWAIIGRRASVRAAKKQISSRDQCGDERKHPCRSHRSEL